LNAVVVAELVVVVVVVVAAAASAVTNASTQETFPQEEKGAVAAWESFPEME
jgi:hypothetical protein